MRFNLARILNTDTGGRNIMGHKRDIEEVVTKAMGNSVTPARLKHSKEPGLIRRLLGNETIEGPFLEDIEQDEQPHYLFHTTNRIEIPEEIAEEGAILSIFGQSTFSPGTLMVTDHQLVLIYKRGTDRIIRRFGYDSIEDVRYQRIPRIERSLNFIVDDNEFTLEMWDPEQFGEELPDAAAYISDKSDVKYTDSVYDFEDGQYDEAVDALREQLTQVGTTAREVNVRLVLDYAKEGAKVGATPRTIALGFLLGAGYGIWADIHRTEADDSPTFDPDVIDPQSTAKEMARWKQFGDYIADRKGGLAGAAIGAAVAIDQQVNDRTSTRVLNELDLEPIGQQLESGQLKEGSLEVTSQVLDSYTEGLGTLLADDFFRQIW